MLLDRDVEVPIAIQTSVKAVLVNPFTMALWGLIVAASLAGGFLLVFAGLAVVVPVLAHSTWHVYRKVVEPAAGRVINFIEIPTPFLDAVVTIIPAASLPSRSQGFNSDACPRQT
jgi:uncharacterized membrane protein